MNIKDLVKEYDPQNQFDVLINSYTQIEHAWENKIDLSSIEGKKFNKIIVSGLGGSAIGGDLIREFLSAELSLPYFVNRNYNLPLFADKETLVIISSYSGNTEETISVLNQAVERGCVIVCLSTGGRIAEIALENNIPLVNLKKGFQPRYALGTGFFSLLRILQILGCCGNQDDTINKIINVWKEKGKEYSEENNKAYLYAEELTGFIPVIYSAADITSAAGYRFKCQFNENSKVHAFHNVIPELNHNEIIGWETFKEKQFYAKLIILNDPVYSPQVKKRFTITSELAAAGGIEILELQSEKEDLKTRLMDLIYLCDWITYYTAVIKGADPTEIKNINILKEKLA
jgi:glucose/mannose-6-phosphate isomerase